MLNREIRAEEVSGTGMKSVRDYALPSIKVMVVKDGGVSRGSRKVSCAASAATLLQNYLRGADRETLVAVLLDSKNGVIGIHTVSVGDVGSSIAHPREIFKAAVIAGAVSIILGHNHPSGDPTPSREDVAVTKRIKEAGDILGIELCDHIIIGDETYCSLKQKGQMP